MAWTLETHIGNVVGVTRGVHLSLSGSSMGVAITGGVAGVVVKNYFILTGTCMIFASLFLVSAFSAQIILPSTVLLLPAVIPVVLVANDNPRVFAAMVFVLLQFSFSGGLGGAVDG